MNPVLNTGRSILPMNVLLCALLACTALLGQDQSPAGTEAPAAAAPATQAPAPAPMTPAAETPAAPAPAAEQPPAAPESQPAASATPPAAPAAAPATPPAAAETSPATPAAATTAPAERPALEPGKPDPAKTSIPAPRGVEQPEGFAPGTSVPTEVKGSWAGLLLLLEVLAILVLPFIVGSFIAQSLRVKEMSFRIGLVLFALTIGFVPFINAQIRTGHWLNAIKLGIDLAGGSNMVFEVDKAAAKAAGKENITADVMDKLVSRVSKRINAGGTEEITVRRVGTDRIEVIVPKASQEQVDAIKRRIVDLGSLEFDILANRFDHQAIIALAEPSRNNPAVNDIYQDDRLIAKWRPVAKIGDTDKLKPVEPDPSVDAPARTVIRDGKEVKELLLVVEPDPRKRITGDFLVRATEQLSEDGPAVGFTFNQYGGFLFNQLTTKYQPREGSHRTRLAILLNEEVHSAPTINAVIGSNGQISGQFTSKEIQELIGVLNAGALDVPLNRKPVNEFTVSPLLGQDIQTKGYRAMLISSISVFVVMAVYYRKLGLIANLCLIVNIVLLMGVMSLINATFTLPGLAGVVLTIGMAVDANVLIYERFREEKSKGSSLRMTIHNGFHKALATIVDSNLTTLITAVVLYVVGTEQVRGFAVSLFIGIVVSMFTALYMGRLLFDLAERKRWLTDISMMEAIKATNIAFSKKTRVFAVLSCSLIALGLGLVAWRGSDNLDIDFRGGSMATFRFDGETPTTDEMQQRLDAAFQEAVAVETLQTVDNPPKTLVRIRSTKDDDNEVSRLVAEAFKDSPQKLIHQSLTAGAVTRIENSTTPEFKDGHEVTLTFDSPVSASTASEAVGEQLAEIKGADGKLKYADALSLVAAINPVNAPQSKEITVRAKSVVTSEDLAAAASSYAKAASGRPLFEELNTFDQAVASETQWIAVTAIVVSMLATILYLWFRFLAVDFGLAAVVAVLHDIFAVLGLVTLASLASKTAIGQSLGLIDFKFNLSLVAAFLTIVGYSLNDTIVVFDRIREVRGKSPTVSKELVDRALNETLSRTLLTGVTTLIVIFIMYALGGEGLKGFAFSLFMGIIIGTYSSMFIASPVLVWLMNRKIKKGGRPGAVSTRAAAL
ncbi:bifunctional preprotein translocase subunit SecD/SecF [Caulifigura coniformis]|uniref:Multifunctional fusion protein n=1 Tax=Caulifigura coniformis TaxID=2527983 RepID=A0A517SC59_9PLAN|nr:protein translocase subunit SecD [Caulifigura coniformis]QDT53711.1 bifunctional preprotein translocase subunit SecD/SecF [Caulifigura coniformis]